MEKIAKFFIWTLICLIFSYPLFSANITILESQSVHPLHKMDNNWKSVASDLGHTATVVGQTFLDDFSNLSNTDVLILSSGLIDIPENRKANIFQFIQNGGNVYIQSEYLVDLAGNATFKYIADSLGDTFNWEDEVTGNLNPMEITGELAEGLSENNSINYYWYGASGSGDGNFKPFLKYNDKNWGFIYCPSDITLGKMITTSDQDWIRVSGNIGLMENILSFLVNNTTLSTLPTVSITTTSSPCDDNYTFDATIENSIPAIEIEWLINGQVVAGENELSFASNNLDDGDVVECRIAVDNACANYTHVSNPILIAPIFPAASPELVISVDNATFCQGQSAIFTATVSQIADAFNLSYQWLRNGTPIAGATIQTFSSDLLDDQDLITCQFSYDDNCSTGTQILSNAITVTVNPSFDPSVLIFADVTTICEGEMVTFVANGTDFGINPSYQWQIDGVNVGDNASMFSSSAITNEQNINCLITTQELCSTTNEANSNIISITVNDVINPNIEIIADTDAICSGEMVTISANANDLGTNPTFQWQIDGLNVGTNQAEFSTTALENGQQITCTLSVTESCANSAAVTSAPISISVSQGLVPTLSISSNVITQCEGGAATFTASGENHGTNPAYEWFVDGVSVNNNATEFILENITSTHEVTCVLINDEACPVNNTTTSNAVTLTNSSIAIEVMELAAENCGNADGLIEVLADGGNAPYSYEWSNGKSNSMITDLQANNYTVIVTDANGCSQSMSFELENNSAPQIADILVSNANCSGDNSQAEILLENPSDNATIEWRNEAGIIINFGLNAEDLTPGNYEIAVTNEYGCVAVETVFVEAISPLTVAVNNDARMDLGTTTTLEAIVNTSENVTYEWYPATGLSCTDCANPTAEPTNDIQYTVIVTNENGCTSTDEVLIHVIPNKDVYVPNAFSPNGDGVNDAFTVFAGSNVAQVKTLKVFDRWGAEVFSNKDFDPNMESEGWNGVYKGKMMNAGVYVFFVEVEYIDGTTKITKGDLSITL